MVEVIPVALCPQNVMARDHPVPSRAKRLRIKRPVETAPVLLNIAALLGGIERLEQHARLHRRHVIYVKNICHRGLP